VGEVSEIGIKLVCKSEVEGLNFNCAVPSGEHGGGVAGFAKKTAKSQHNGERKSGQPAQV